jgi:LacI family transcriptional regulator
MTSQDEARGRPGAAYRKVAAAIREKIASGEWPAGEELPSLRAMAGLFGVGQNTVRLAVDQLKRECRVLLSPRRRLVAAVPEGAWSATGSLMLLVIDRPLNEALSARFYREMIHGVQVGVGAAGHSLLVVHHRRLRGEFPADALDLPVRGVLLIGAFDDRALAQYEGLGVPGVLLDEYAGGRRLHSVSIDNRGAGREAGRRLLALGHRRIAFLRTIRTSRRRVEPDLRDRQQGLFEALEEAGLPAGSELVHNAMFSDTPDSPALKSLLGNSPRFTAVLCTGLAHARLVEQAARSRGMSVPGDLSVACFQEEPPGDARFGGPRVDFEDLGRQALELLAEPKHPPRHQRVRARWAAGSTVGPPPAG